MRCTADGCRHQAAMQWDRAATPAEARAEADRLHHTQAAIAKHSRSVRQLHAVEMRARLDTVTGRAEAGDRDAQKVLPAVREQLAAAETALAEVTEPPAADPGEVRVTVFACTVHAIPADRAGWLHETDCLTDGTCRCQPPASGETT